MFFSTRIFAFALSLIMASTTQATVFKNSYVSFEMPDTWNCLLEITEWVCRSKEPAEAKEAVIVITAKEKGPSDSFDIYKDHLSKSIENTSKSGIVLNSIVKYPAQEQKINDQLWLDSVHQDSEVANYFTRYLATINGDVAMLLTFSAHNSVYAKYSTVFDRAVRSLKVLSGSKNLTDDSIGNMGKAGEKYGPNEIGTGFAGKLEDEEESFASMVLTFISDTFVLGIIFMVLSLGSYFGLAYLKKKQKKKKEDIKS